MKVAIYLRVSTLDQATKNNPLRAPIGAMPLDYLPRIVSLYVVAAKRKNRKERRKAKGFTPPRAEQRAHARHSSSAGAAHQRRSRRSPAKSTTCQPFLALGQNAECRFYLIRYYRLICHPELARHTSK